MKQVKMLGIAAVATAAFLAIIGAGSASATVLCSVQVTEGCGVAGNKYGANQEIHAVLKAGQKTKIVTAKKSIECSRSTIKGKLAESWTGSATSTPTGPVEAVTFEECNCEIVEVKAGAGGSFEVHWIAGSDNGTVTSTGLEITTICQTIFGKLHCTYKSNKSDLGTLIGGNPATLAIKNGTLFAEPAQSDKLCEENNAEWVGEYEVTTPKPLWVANA